MTDKIELLANASDTSHEIVVRLYARHEILARAGWLLPNVRMSDGGR